MCVCVCLKFFIKVTQRAAKSARLVSGVLVAANEEEDSNKELVTLEFVMLLLCKF